MADRERAEKSERPKDADDEPRGSSNTPSCVTWPIHHGPDGEEGAQERNGDNDDHLRAVGLDQRLRHGAVVGRHGEGGRQEANIESN